MNDDAKDVEQIRSGNVDAFSNLMDRHYSIVCGIISRRGVRDFDDAAQETFIKAYRQLDSLDNPEKFAGWLYRIAFNVSMDFHRKKALNVSRIDTDIVEASPAGSDIIPDRSIIREESGQKVRDAMLELPEHYYLALTLRFYEQLSIDEVAERLGVPAGTVKSQIHRGLKLLAERLGSAGESGLFSN
ncbi:MAG: sigma-70 family RNA polymerase sigma factor [Planctomycetes bacterium]|nr:sigma-70 family RNA polymerase sigma factor [Planctomycetota bacterium]